MINIAIDGPAGSGKSSVARTIAHRLGLLHLDTGAMYRAAALAVLRSNVPSDDETALAVAAQAACDNISVSIGTNGQRTYLYNEDVSSLIRSPEVSSLTSIISTIPIVREKMVALQQKVAAAQNVIMDGRDIGTRVLPNATLKVYLTATPEVRATRRLNETPNALYSDILNAIIERDHRDSTRVVDPLRPADDAIVIDTSEMTQDEVVDRILGIYYNTINK